MASSAAAVCEIQSLLSKGPSRLLCRVSGWNVASVHWLTKRDLPIESKGLLLAAQNQLLCTRAGQHGCLNLSIRLHKAGWHPAYGTT